MKKLAVFLVVALAATILFTGQASALSNPATGAFTYFYKPPKDGTAVSSIVSLNRYIILTHGDESYRDSLKQAGYAGPVLEYLGAAEVDGPGPYANSSATCDSSFVPWRNQVAIDPGDFCTYLHPYESYFLHNSSGARIYEDNGNGHITYYMNPASTGWRSFYVQRALRFLQGDATHAAYGFNGLFLDNVWVSLWTLVNRMAANTSGAYPKEYTSDSAYDSAMAGFLSQLKSNLNATGKFYPVVGNMAGDTYSSTSWDAYLPYVDGGMEEAFAADWNTGYPSVSEWLTDLQKAEKTVGQGKVHFAITQGAQSDTARMRFGYASYLLTMQPGKSFFRYAKASTGYEYQWNYSDYWTDIGTPSGARYQQSDGSWRRNFTRGYVVVNPSTHAAQIVQQAAASPTNTPTPTATTQTLTFNPAADAYVNQLYPTTNYGSSAQLRTDGSPYVNSYLRFNVQGLSGTVTSATLKLYANSSLISGYTVRAVSNNSWSESTINYSNAPALGSAINSSSAVSAYTWVSVNVTSYIHANGTFTLAITDPSSTALSLASRESTNKPRLVITTR